MNRAQTLQLLAEHLPVMTFYQEDLLGHPVDLATDKSLRPYIEKAAVRV
jgi:predicted nucleotidyltransferase